MKLLTTDNVEFEIDDEDFEKISKYKWYADKRKNGFIYIKSTDAKRIYLHKLILGIPKHSAFCVDHVDRNTCNNKKSNLRKASYTENCINKSIQSNNTSGYRGVYWAAHANKWRAQIEKYGKIFRLGYFSTPESAAKAYNEKAKELFGEFVVLNTL